MEEVKIITIGDVIDSTVMHINKGNPLFARESKGNPHGTQGNPVTGLNSQHSRLLVYFGKIIFCQKIEFFPPWYMLFCDISQSKISFQGALLQNGL